MKKIARLLLMAVIMSILTCNTAFASSTAPSLDDITSNNGSNTQDNTTQSNGSSSSRIDVQEDKNSIIDALSQGADMSKVNDKAATVGNVISEWVGIVIQIISYVIIAGLALRIMLDLMYIGLPFTRSLLANGYMGNPNAGGQPNQQQGMGIGMGMGTGMGMGGYGSRYGGMGSGMGTGMGMGMGGMQNNMISNQTAMNNQPKMGRMQLVSNAALNAVAIENTVGPDGETHNPFKIYVKDMVVILTLTPILITLAATGILAKLGFALAGLLVRGIGSLIGGM